MDTVRFLVLGALLTAVVITLSSCMGATNPLDQLEELKPSNNLAAPTPHPDAMGNYPPEQVSRGKYLVELMGCGTCHTDGALMGQPDMQRQMAGSSVGIAYTNPMDNPRPGVTYPANLTPDTRTGVGSWSDQQIAGAIRHGTGAGGKRLLTVMPWPAFIRMTDEDALAIAAYLRSLPAVEHKVPANVAEGNKASAPFVYFGVYRSRN